MIVESHNEWDRLQSVVIGTATGANWPSMDPTFLLNWQTSLFKELPHPAGPVAKNVIDETNEDLDELANTLSSAGVEVFRPKPNNYAAKVGGALWQTDQMYGYCPRDTHLIVGKTVIEAPMSYRARQFEADLLSDIRISAIKDGANWLAAPRPTLPVGTHSFNGNSIVLLEDEPIFDASNCIRMNKDILYQHCASGNHRGADWLQQILGKEYKVHVLQHPNISSHLDNIIAPIREGLVVLNQSKITLENMPQIFVDQKWDIIWFNDFIAQSYYQYPYETIWVGMNLLMLDKKTAIVEKTQVNLIRELEKNKIEVWPMMLRHARTLGGGFHSVTLDLNRQA